MFEITFLGTSASAPSVHRGLSAQVIAHNEYRFLVDCGEGTQRQILQSGLGFKRLERILITHGHLDHILGLAGLVSTFLRWETIDRLEIWGGRWALDLETQRERLTDLIVREVGKPRRAAEEEVGRAVAHVRIAAELAHDPAQALLRIAPGVAAAQRPLGVVGLVTPWNNPLAIPVGKKNDACDAGPPSPHGNGCSTVQRRPVPAMVLSWPCMLSRTIFWPVVSTTSSPEPGT